MDDDDNTVASSDADDSVSATAVPIAVRSPRRASDRSRRIVERWTERDYDVPDSRGGRRQVTVIRRNSGGGLFESLFGN